MRALATAAITALAYLYIMHVPSTSDHVILKRKKSTTASTNVILIKIVASVVDHLPSGKWCVKFHANLACKCRMIKTRVVIHYDATIDASEYPAIEMINKITLVLTNNLCGKCCNVD